MDNFAARISEEAKAVLPSKEDWAHKGLEGTDLTPRYNIISATLGIGLVSLPKGVNPPIGADSAFVAADITNAYRFGTRYDPAASIRNFP